MTDLTDDSLMPWGKHKGTPLKDVPASYLLWCYEQPWMKEGWPKLYRYLKANEDLLMKEKVEHEDHNYDDRGFESYEDYRSHRGF